MPPVTKIGMPANFAASIVAETVVPPFLFYQNVSKN